MRSWVRRLDSLRYVRGRDSPREAVRWMKVSSQQILELAALKASDETKEETVLPA